MNRRHRWFQYYVRIIITTSTDIPLGSGQIILSHNHIHCPEPGPLVICTHAVDMPGSRRCHRAYTVTVSSHSIIQLY